tara:strand:- start:1165 stop:2088 length:924 start_codon:yes stop_codon:yes gene_type:complete
MILIRYILFFLLFFSPLKAVESFIEFKINDEIVTNIDLDTEYRYLIALNNELRNTDEDTLKKLSRESIIKEKIKKNELKKYYQLKGSSDYLDEVIKVFYEKVGMKNIEEFRNYLNEYDLDLDIVRNKIEIEMLWNKLIGLKYSNQLNINKEFLEKQVEKQFDKNEFITEYELSEIMFQTTGDISFSNKLNLILKDVEEQGFKNAANIHSISDSSKFGGKIGWLDEKQLSQSIFDAIQNLEIGNISKPVRVANGFLILKIDNKKQKKIIMDKKKLLEKAIQYETTKQYNQFSIIYYNKIKLNSVISEL